MHIKHIHDMVEKLSECAKMELDKGIEKVDTKEMSEVAEIIKELSEAEYYAKISKAMDEAEYGEDYDYMGAYDDGRRGYRGQPRDSMGRYTSRKGRGRRMGYEEPWDEMYDEMEYMRDVDRPTMNRMYYSGSGSSGGSGMSSGSNGGSSGGSMGGGSMGSSGGGSRGYSDGMRDYREGRSGQMRRGYMEAKEMGKEKQEKMKELENYMKTMAEDLTEAIEGASPEERAMAKQKLSVLVSKM